MRKQVLVSVDRGETRVALLEATGQPDSLTKSRPARGRKKDAAAGFRVAELYLERRGNRSIVGNIYKGKVDNVLPGLEAAFVDIGLDKNGFLHVDEIVLPGVETPRRGRGKEGGKKITDLLKPGQEIVVQVVKDPLKTKGARLSMELTIAGRYMVYAPTGEGVGVSKRLDDKERARLRREAKELDLQGGGAIIRTAAQGASRAGLRARDAVPLQAQRGAPQAGGGHGRPGDGVPGGRPLRPRRARHLLRRLRARARRRREAAPPARLLLHAHRARARRPRRALRGAQDPALRGLRRREGHRRPHGPARRPAERRLPHDRLRRGADGHRRQLRLVRRPRQAGPPGGHDPQDEPRGGRGGRQRAAPARHRRHHRHRLHRHGPRAQPRRGHEGAAHLAGGGPHEDVHRRDLQARTRRDDAPERHRGRARDHLPALPDLRRRRRHPLRGDDRDRVRAPAARSRRRRARRTSRRSSCR